MHRGFRLEANSSSFRLLRTFALGYDGLEDEGQTIVVFGLL